MPSDDVPQENPFAPGIASHVMEPKRSRGWLAGTIGGVMLGCLPGLTAWVATGRLATAFLSGRMQTVSPDQLAVAVGLLVGISVALQYGRLVRRTVQNVDTVRSKREEMNAEAALLSADLHSRRSTANDQPG